MVKPSTKIGALILIGSVLVSPIPTSWTRRADNCTADYSIQAVTPFLLSATSIGRELGAPQDNFGFLLKPNPHQQTTADFRTERYFQFLEMDEQIKEDIASLKIPDFTMHWRPSMVPRILHLRMAKLNRQFNSLIDLLATQAGVSHELISTARQRVAEIASDYDAHSQSLFNPYDLMDLYGEYVMRMDPKFLNRVNEEVYSYSGVASADLPDLVRATRTYNELLNLLHTYATREISILDGLKSWDQTEILQSPKIQCIGDDTPLVRLIITSLAKREDLLPTIPPLIVSANNTVQLIFRDIGHATTLRIEANGLDEYKIEYYIPKIYTPRFLKRIPGAKTLQELFFNDDRALWAKGRYWVPRKRLGAELIRLIQIIPNGAQSISISQAELGQARRQFAEKFDIPHVSGVHGSVRRFDHFVFLLKHALVQLMYLAEKEAKELVQYSQPLHWVSTHYSEISKLPVDAEVLQEVLTALLMHSQNESYYETRPSFIKQGLIEGAYNRVNPLLAAVEKYRARQDRRTKTSA